MVAVINLGLKHFGFNKDAPEPDGIIWREYQAYYGLGYSYLMMGSYDEALQNLNEALRIKPDYIEAQILLDKVYTMATLGIKPTLVFPQ